LKLHYFTTLALAVPLYAQYSGPAILSRGEAPSELTLPDIRFCPQVSVGAVYDTGLAGIAVNDSGQLAQSSSPGYYVSWGISGNHHWRHTQIGLDYSGSVNRYDKNTEFNSLNQTFLFNVTHQFTKHIALRATESAGMFSRNYVTAALSETVPFDPSTTFVPRTDFFDNRTIYATSALDMIIQKTSRLSFDLAGTGFTNSRQSKSLADAWGVSAQGDAQYRWTRMMTVGGFYRFTHFGYSSAYGGTDIHGFAGTFAIRLNRRWEATGYAGVMRLESKYLQEQVVDPIIAALLGISQSYQISHVIQYAPDVAGRLSRSFRRGVLFFSGGHSVTAGNGLFLSSVATTASVGYTYTAFRHWSLNAQGVYITADSQGGITGRYGNTMAVFSAGRQLGRYTHISGSYMTTKYHSPDYTNYNRRIDTATVTIGFSPGEIRLGSH
jgi:hypothetical protein